MTLNILWWLAFFVIGLALQQALPGTDVLVVGLFLALQERRPVQIAVVLVLLILRQEGVGTLDFGASVLWYFLASGCLGAAHGAVIWLMTRLQYIPLETAGLVDESILQALLTPVLWQACRLARRWVVSHENNTA